jgi:hypothetical protein
MKKIIAILGVMFVSGCTAGPYVIPLKLGFLNCNTVGFMPIKGDVTVEEGWTSFVPQGDAETPVKIKHVYTNGTCVVAVTNEKE